MENVEPAEKAKGREAVVRRVLVVDDHPIVREGLSQLIETAADLTVCGTASEAEKVLGRVEELQPDMVLLDITLRGGSGLDVCRELSHVYPSIPVLILSMHNEDVYAERALRVGAKGYQMKDASPGKLLDAIRRILSGQVHLSEAIHSKVARRLRMTGKKNVASEQDRLTDRELEIFEMIGQGLPTRRIADDLSLSMKTVETHRANIKRKLQLADANELVHRAVFYMANSG